MAYSTQSDVDDIIEVEDGDDLTVFIAAGDRLIDEVIGTDITDTDHLKQISTWLGAHFYVMLRPEKSLQGVSLGKGAVNPQFKGKVDLGLDYTRYGQMAMQLDTTGKLAAHNEAVKKGKGRTVGVTWLGTEDA